jgi:hypothetical protein
VDMGHIFYFPSARKACFVDFYHTGKIQRLWLGLNPRTRVPEASMLTTRPPKPSSQRLHLADQKYINTVFFLHTNTLIQQELVVNRLSLFQVFNPLNAELNPIRHLLALAGAHHFVDVSRIRPNPLNAELNPIRHLLALAGNPPFCPR